MTSATGLTALLFDLDGTIVDTDRLHFRAWQQVFADHGQSIDERFYKERVSGRFNPMIVREHLPQVEPAQVDAVLGTKEERFMALAGSLQPTAGLDVLLEWARQRALKTALVTNAPAGNARFLLSHLGLADAFTTVVLAEHVSGAKPDAAPYIAALERLDIPAAAALAFEDSPSGIRSALAAGVAVAGLTTTHDDVELRSAGALLTIADFRAEDLWSYLATL